MAGDPTEIYYDPSHPAGFGSLNQLKNATGKSKKEIKKWSLQQDTYTLHKPTIKKFQRVKIVTMFPHELWQGDLCDLKDLAKYNDGYKYLFNVIDCFSKLAWCVPMKTKTGVETAEAFQRILDESGHIPMKFNTDKGKEFLNVQFQNLLKDKSITFFTANNPDIKASIVERFNRTLKTRMWKYFTAKQTWRYIDVLQQLMDSYNSRTHSSTGFAPIEINTKNMFRAYMKMFGQNKKNKSDYKFQVGDKVRISKSKMTFEKGYYENWTPEIFTVSRRLNTKPPLYKIKDWNGEEIESIFYAQELQAVEADAEKEYLIEKVIRTKGNRALVKWLGYSDSFNSWVPKKDVVLLNR